MDSFLQITSLIFLVLMLVFQDCGVYAAPIDRTFTIAKKDVNNSMTVIKREHLGRLSGAVYRSKEEMCSNGSSTQETPCRTLCGWEYEINHDPNRIPRTIVQASEPLNKSCNTDGYRCQRLYRRTFVLHLDNDCERGSCEYKAADELIPVGAVCKKV